MTMVGGYFSVNLLPRIGKSGGVLTVVLTMEP